MQKGQRILSGFLILEDLFKSRGRKWFLNIFLLLSLA
jgi:hypothetical protein